MCPMRLAGHRCFIQRPRPTKTTSRRWSAGLPFGSCGFGKAGRDSACDSARPGPDRQQTHSPRPCTAAAHRLRPPGIYADARSRGGESGSPPSSLDPRKCLFSSVKFAPPRSPRRRAQPACRRRSHANGYRQGHSTPPGVLHGGKLRSGRHRCQTGPDGVSAPDHASGL